MGKNDLKERAIPCPWKEAGQFIEYLTSEKKGFHINIKIIIFGVLARIITLLLAQMFLQNNLQDASFLGVFNSFNRWDAGHYLRLAEHGYGLPYYRPEPSHIFVVFFPLYPWLVRLVSVATRSYLAAAYVVSFGSYLAGLCYLYHLVKHDFSERTAWWAIVLISIFPFSFFFGAPHTESLFLLTTTMTLYYIRKHNWFLAGISGALASATRMVGIALIFAAAVEFVMHYKLFTLMKKGKWEEFFSLIGKKGLFILLMLVGVLVYLNVNYHTTGDSFRFMYYQRTHWSQGFLYFGQTMRMQFDNLPTYIGDISQNSGLYIHLPNILSFAFVVWAILYGSLKRHNASHLVYAMGYVFVSFSLSWLLSGGRYASALVPAFIFLADYVERKPHRRLIVPVIFILLFLPILRMYVLGGWVM